MNALTKPALIFTPLFAVSWFGAAFTPQMWSHVIALAATVAMLVLFVVVPVMKRLRDVRELLDTKRTADRTTESRLSELDELKRKDIVTPEEYAVKRQEILKDL